MPRTTLVNFAAGETSPRSRGRFDLPWFASSCEKLLNFIPEIPGSARYRTGFKYARTTRGGAVARLVPFQVSSEQVYMLEFTAGFMRVYKDEDLLTITRTTITAISREAVCRVTVASTTNLANGDEVIITGIVGMEELNNRQVKLANKAGSIYELVDPVTGAAINSTGYTAWSSGGTVKEVYEIASPYLEVDLADMSFTGAVDGKMYFAHRRYAPRKLTMSSAEVFTLGTYVRTNDPFIAQLSVLTIDNTIELGARTVVSFAAGSIYSEDVDYTFSTIVGTTELNAGVYKLSFEGTASAYVRAYLRNATTGAHVDSSAWTPYVSGGIATPAVENPVATCFYEGRHVFLGTNQRPDTLFLSKAPSTTTGASQHDVFTGGTAAVDACFFALAPVNGQIAQVAWGRGTPKYLIVGTYGGPFRVSGGGLDEPITPTAVNARQFDGFGCEAVAPAGNARVFFIQRGGTALLTTTYNSDSDDIEAYDMLLNAEHIADSRLQRVVLQMGRPHILWVTREDGSLAGVTVQGNENVAGWHRHKMGGHEAQVLDAQVVSRTDRSDQLWAVTARSIGGVTRRFVEIQADDVVFPDKADFYLGQGAINRANDLEGWRNAVYRRQEEYIHLDAAATYNGADRGETAAATLTPGRAGETEEALDIDDVVEFNPVTTYLARDRVKVGSYVSVDYGAGRTLHFAVPVGQALSVTGLSAQTSASDALEIAVSGPNLLMNVANATPAKNSAAAIQAALRAYAGGGSAQFDLITVTENAAYAANRPITGPVTVTAWTVQPTGTAYMAVTEVTGNLFPPVETSFWYPLTDGEIPPEIFVASAAVFVSGDVGNELWKKPNRDTGVGGGRATIIGFISTTIVVADVTVDFDTTAAIAAGDWHFAVETIRGLWHLEGQVVAVVADGAVYSDGSGDVDADYPHVAVANGAITLTDPAAVVHVGLPYEGFLKTHNLNAAAPGKAVSIVELIIRFLSTLGVDYGTDLYDLDSIEHRDVGNDPLDRPAPVFSGARKVRNADSSLDSTKGKHVIIAQRLPLPCVVQSVDVHYDGPEGE